MIQGCPSSARIVTDVNKVLKSMVIIHQHKGAVVQGLGNRNGHRAQAATAGNKSRRGGARKRDAEKQRAYLEGTWWHPDALSQLDVKLESSMEKRLKVSVVCQLCVLCLLLSLLL